MYIVNDALINWGGVSDGSHLVAEEIGLFGQGWNSPSHTIKTNHKLTYFEYRSMITLGPTHNIAFMKRLALCPCFCFVSFLYFSNFNFLFRNPQPNRVRKKLLVSYFLPNLTFLLSSWSFKFSVWHIMSKLEGVNSD